VSLFFQQYKGFSTPNKSSERLVTFPTFSFTASSFELVNLWDKFPAVSSLLGITAALRPKGFFSLYPSGGKGLEPSTLGQPLRNLTCWIRTERSVIIPEHSGHSLTLNRNIHLLERKLNMSGYLKA
jgi:hypothetical protein